MDTTITSIFTEEQKCAIMDTTRKIFDAIKELWERFKLAVKPLIDAYFDFIKQIQKCAASPRSYHLAYHSKKARVRKKNKTRIFEVLKRIKGEGD